MEPERFDAVARRFARGASRRAVLSGLFGITVSGAFARFRETTRAHAAQDCAFFCPEGQVLDANCACVWPSVIDCASLTDCGGFCIDTFNDPANCGVCGNPCASGICSGGACAEPALVPEIMLCDPALTDCGGVCVDLDSDPWNCGLCGQACESGACTNAQCAIIEPAPTACGSGLMDCFGVCVDVLTDPNHCSGCGLPCDSGSCTGGACDLVAMEPDSPAGCEAPLVDCTGDGLCVDLSSDPNHCGVCGNPCESGSCVESLCEPVRSGLGMRQFCPFPDGECEGPGSCFDTNTDPNHCGGCGNACASGVCASRQCSDGAASCDPGFTACDGSCVDTNSDPVHCGACGSSCSSGTPCIGGVCDVCYPLTKCNGVCVDIMTDPYNCGGCAFDNPDHIDPDGNEYYDLRCPGNQPCVNGQCVADSPDDRSGCGDGLTDCGGYCVYLSSDPRHCGGCDLACDGDCADGQCVPAPKICAAGRVNCCEQVGDTHYDNCCVNLSTNFRNCGSCGYSCAPGQQCVNGSCAEGACDAGLVTCDGACVSLGSHPGHCGECGRVCDSGRCDSGECAPADACDNQCADGDGQVCCGGVCCGGMGFPSVLCCDEVCVDTDVEANHCGGCGTSCASGETCAGGQCIAPGTTPSPEPETTSTPSPDRQCASGSTACRGACVANCASGKILDRSTCRCTGEVLSATSVPDIEIEPDLAPPSSNPSASQRTLPRCTSAQLSIVSVVPDGYPSEELPLAIQVRDQAGSPLSGVGVIGPGAGALGALTDVRGIVRLSYGFPSPPAKSAEMNHVYRTVSSCDSEGTLRFMYAGDVIGAWAPITLTDSAAVFMMNLQMQAGIDPSTGVFTPVGLLKMLAGMLSRIVEILLTILDVGTAIVEYSFQVGDTLHPEWRMYRSAAIAGPDYEFVMRITRNGKTVYERSAWTKDPEFLPPIPEFA